MYVGPVHGYGGHGEQHSACALGSIRALCREGFVTGPIKCQVCGDKTKFIYPPLWSANIKARSALKSVKLNMDQATWNNSQNCYLYKSKYGDLVQRVRPFLRRQKYRSAAAATYVARARPTRAGAEVLRRRAGRDQCTAGNQPTDSSESTQPARTTRRVGKM